MSENWYDRVILPRLIHWACGGSTVTRQRQKLLPRAHGRVLELGMGSGLNLAFYDPDRVTEVVGLEPSAPLRDMSAEAAQAVSFTTSIVDYEGDRIPAEDQSFDCAVVTYALCTIPDVAHVLNEVRRVLKPGGALYFCEHGLAPDPGVARWQRRLTPTWKHFAGGCHLDRDIVAVLQAAGFSVQDTDTMYLPGGRPFGFNTWGSATP